MQSLMKINGVWKEGTPYLKEGGTWKEIGAVTAKANGKWADIAPPKPQFPRKPRTWTNNDFVGTGFKKHSISIGEIIPGDTFNVSNLFGKFYLAPSLGGVECSANGSMQGTYNGEFINPDKFAYPGKHKVGSLTGPLIDGVYTDFHIYKKDYSYELSVFDMSTGVPFIKSI